MAPSSRITLLVLLGVAFVAHASDPDILTDFVVPSGTNASVLDGAFFTYTGLIADNSANPAKFTVSKATAAEFPALLGQSVSYAALVFGPGTVNPPHVHPRASELLYVVQGPLMVGLVDETKNELYAQTLQTGDMFVFPKGMVHFQFNGGDHMARAFSAFGSASPGTVSLPVTLFESGIPDAVLEKSLHVDEATVHALEHDLAPPAPAPAPDSPPAPKNGAASLVPACFSLLVGFAAALLLL
ncbi:germin-like protein 9-1 [Triticum urartu]|nr:germin-like protein 9-1 [Triticum urartu]